MYGTGAVKPGVFKWIITCRGPVIAVTFCKLQRRLNSTTIAKKEEHAAMMTPDDQGQFWHPGTKIGVVYAIAMAVVILLTAVVPKDVPSLWWLEKLQFVVLLTPIAAASHAYVVGLRHAKVDPKKTSAP